LITAATFSADGTRSLAEAVAGLAHDGDVLLLAGDLGSGKTTFAQGFGRGLGVEEPITSPTFTLVRTYPGKLTLVHADLYRLDSVAEVEDLGLPELMDQGGVALVEWGDVAASALAEQYLEVRLEMGPRPAERQVEILTVGREWLFRAEALKLATQPWRSPGRAAG